MTRLALLLLICAAILSSCTSIETRITTMQAHAAACLKTGELVESALSCLQQREAGEIDTGIRGEILVEQSGPYWGFPFLGGYSTLIIKTDNDRVLSWQITGYVGHGLISN